MKKLFVLMLALVMCLAACGTQPADPTTIATVPTTVKMWMYQDCPVDDVVISTIELIEE